MSDWYYAHDSQQQGPINESELVAKFATKELPPDTLVWKDGLSEWTRANLLQEFTLTAPPPPRSAPPLSPSAPAAASAAASAPTPPAASETVPVSTEETIQVDPQDAAQNKAMGILAYLWILFLVPLLAAPNSPFARYHANQGLVLFLACLVTAVASFMLNIILAFIPVLGWIVGILISFAIFAGWVAMVIIGILNAAGGVCKPLPVIGKFNLIK